MDRIFHNPPSCCAESFAPGCPNSSPGPGLPNPDTKHGGMQQFCFFCRKNIFSVHCIMFYFLFQQKRQTSFLCGLLSSYLIYHKLFFGHNPQFFSLKPAQIFVQYPSYTKKGGHARGMAVLFCLVVYFNGYFYFFQSASFAVRQAAFSSCVSICSICRRCASPRQNAVALPQAVPSRRAWS